MIDSADEVTALLSVTTAPLRLRFTSDKRVYIAELRMDLLGDWVVTQIWGGKNDRRGRGKTIAVRDPEAGLTLLDGEARKAGLPKGRDFLAFCTFDRTQGVQRVRIEGHHPSLRVIAVQNLLKTG